MRKKKKAKLIVAVVVVILVTLLLLISVGISKKMEPIGDLLNIASTEITTKEENSDIIDTVRGTALKQSGTPEERSIQCVSDFFEQSLPDLGYSNRSCEVKKLDSTNYCVYVGDWYIIVGYEYNVAYLKGYYKNVDFTDYEKKSILKIAPTAKFTVVDGKYKLEV